MGSPESDSKMGVPEAVLEKVGSLPDVGSMSKDDLAKLCKELYDRSCNVFGEKFDVEYQVKKRDMEIHNLEMETSESHGTFKIPKLKKVNKFKMMEGEEVIYLLYSNFNNIYDMRFILSNHFSTKAHATH